MPKSMYSADFKEEEKFNADGYLGSNEWASGYKVAKDGTKASTAKYSWNTTKKGTRYQDTKGNYLKKQWATINGKRYYFKATGYRAAGEWLNGYKFNNNGTQTYKYKAAWKKGLVKWPALFLLINASRRGFPLLLNL
ncbi:MAG: hypothetical protein K5897_01445 [Eubacterium sp.]|nr:hypothetical protein [Eubacterium sp.]